MAAEDRPEPESLDATEATLEEGAEIIDRAARERLGISGAEFMARWDRGCYRDGDDPDVTGVVMLIPFVVSSGPSPDRSGDPDPTRSDRRHGGCHRISHPTGAP